jgi:hypothetical protein
LQEHGISQLQHSAMSARSSQRRGVRAKEPAGIRIGPAATAPSILLKSLLSMDWPPGSKDLNAWL